MSSVEIITIIVSVLAGLASIFSVYFAYTKFKLDDLKKKRISLTMVTKSVFGKGDTDSNISTMMLNTELSKSINSNSDEGKLDSLILESLTSYKLGMISWKEVNIKITELEITDKDVIKKQTKLSTATKKKITDVSSSKEKALSVVLDVYLISKYLPTSLLDSSSKDILINSIPKDLKELSQLLASK